MNSRISLDMSDRFILMTPATKREKTKE